MFELVKNVIADKETTCEPKRNLPTISFCYDDFSTQQQFIFLPSCDWLELFLYIIKIPSVICGRSSSHMFCQNELRTYQDARRVHAQLILTFYFIARSPRPYLQKYHRQARDVIITYCSKSCLQKSLYLIWYSNLPLTSLTATDGCFNFGSSSSCFFEINGV